MTVLADPHGRIPDIHFMADQAGVFLKDRHIAGCPGIRFIAEPDLLEGGGITRVDGIIVKDPAGRGSA